MIYPNVNIEIKPNDLGVTRENKRSVYTRTNKVGKIGRWDEYTTRGTLLDYTLNDVTHTAEIKLTKSMLGYSIEVLNPYPIIVY